MKWFRKHVKLGSRLALFALAIQFALSFGHFHGAAAQTAPAKAGVTQADLALAKSLVAGAANEAAQRQRPANHDGDQQPGEPCAICAVISLASNVLFATPPLLELPQAVEFHYRTTDAEFVHLKSAPSAFRSRAPPLS